MKNQKKITKTHDFITNLYFIKTGDEIQKSDYVFYE